MVMSASLSVERAFVPSPQDLVARARAMIPTLRQRAARCVAGRDVPAETIDMNQQQANSNENYVDYYNDGASVNNVGSGKDSAIVGNDIDYDSTSIASNQHSSMLRNGVQLSHERSSYDTYSSSSSSSVYFLIPFKSIVVITVFFVYFIYN